MKLEGLAKTILFLLYFEAEPAPADAPAALTGETLAERTKAERKAISNAVEALATAGAVVLQRIDAEGFTFSSVSITKKGRELAEAEGVAKAAHPNGRARLVLAVLNERFVKTDSFKPGLGPEAPELGGLGLTTKQLGDALDRLLAAKLVAKGATHTATYELTREGADVATDGARLDAALPLPAKPVEPESPKKIASDAKEDASNVAAAAPAPTAPPSTATTSVGAPSR